MCLTRTGFQCVHVRSFLQSIISTTSVTALSHLSLLSLYPNSGPLPTSTRKVYCTVVVVSVAHPGATWGSSGIPTNASFLFPQTVCTVLFQWLIQVPLEAARACRLTNASPHSPTRSSGSLCHIFHTHFGDMYYFLVALTRTPRSLGSFFFPLLSYESYCMHDTK